MSPWLISDISAICIPLRYTLPVIALDEESTTNDIPAPRVFLSVPAPENVKVKSLVSIGLPFHIQKERAHCGGGQNAILRQFIYSLVAIGSYFIQHGRRAIHQIRLRLLRHALRKIQSLRPEVECLSDRALICQCYRIVVAANADSRAAFRTRANIAVILAKIVGIAGRLCAAFATVKKSHGYRFLLNTYKTPTTAAAISSICVVSMPPLPKLIPLLLPNLNDADVEVFNTSSTLAQAAPEKVRISS